MKKTLVALSLVFVAAAGCADDSDQQPPIYDMYAMPSDFEVILVDAVDFRSEVVDDNLPMAPSDGDLSFAQNDDAYVGGADQLSGETTRNDDEVYGGGDLGRGDLAETFARPGYGEIDGELARSGYSELGGTEASADIPLDPCQCLDASCRQRWVEVNLGCNVCAVFSCGEQNIPHSCNACL